MFAIKDLNNNTIELQGLKDYSNKFEILSFNENGKRMPFFTELVTSNDISVELFNICFINVTINVKNIIKDEYIVFKNINGEKLILTIKPNNYFVEEREYKFKITKSEFTKDGKLKLKIYSKVNGEDIGWKCIYKGKPIDYNISPIESYESTYVTVELLSEMLTDYVSTLIFEQKESGKKIEYKINNTTEGMKKAG